MNEVLYLVVVIVAVVVAAEIARVAHGHAKLTAIRIERELQAELESAAADLALSIEEDVAATLRARPDLVITARDKAQRFIARARHELPQQLDDDALFKLLGATLPKIGLGAFAGRVRSQIVEKVSRG